MDLFYQVDLRRFTSLDPQDVLWISRSIGKRLTSSDRFAIIYLDLGQRRHCIFAAIFLLILNYDLAFLNADNAGQRRSELLFVYPSEHSVDIDAVPLRHECFGSRRYFGYVAIVLAADYFDVAGVAFIVDRGYAINLAYYGLSLGHACLEELFDARQAGGDVLTGYATCVECAHRELGAGLAYALSGNNSNRFSQVHELTSGQT